MFGLSQSQVCPIGIDIGSHSVRMFQFRRKGDQLAMQAACRIELDALGESQSAAARLAKAMERGLTDATFNGRTAVLSVPPAMLNAKSVRLPQMPDSDLHQALQWEAKDRFGFEIGNGRLVWFRAGEVRRGTEIKDELLLFAVRGETLSLYLDAAAAAGLTVAAIDIAPCASYRSAWRAGFDHTPSVDSFALLDIGQAGSQFIITRNEQLVFYKHIDIGADTIDRAVGQKLGISAAEASQMRARLATADAAGEEAPLAQALQDAVRPPLDELARELDMCMRYFVITFRGVRPDLITITGRQANCPRILENLAATLALRVEPARPLRGVLDLGDVARPDRSGEWSVAAGLSLYPVGKHSGEAAA
jgi:type IV pilus assembly protein PilM